MNLHVVDVVVQLGDERGVAVGLAVGDGEGVEQQDERAVLGIDGLAFIRTTGASFTCSGICIMFLLVFFSLY